MPPFIDNTRTWWNGQSKNAKVGLGILAGSLAVGAGLIYAYAAAVGTALGILGTGAIGAAMGAQGGARADRKTISGIAGGSLGFLGGYFAGPLTLMAGLASYLGARDALRLTPRQSAGAAGLGAGTVIVWPYLSTLSLAQIPTYAVDGLTSLSTTMTTPTAIVMGLTSAASGYAISSSLGLKGPQRLLSTLLSGSATAIAGASFAPELQTAVPALLGPANAMAVSLTTAGVAMTGLAATKGVQGLGRKAFQSKGKMAQIAGAAAIIAVGIGAFQEFAESSDPERDYNLQNAFANAANVAMSPVRFVAGALQPLTSDPRPYVAPVANTAVGLITGTHEFFDKASLNVLEVANGLYVPPAESVPNEPVVTGDAGAQQDQPAPPEPQPSPKATEEPAPSAQPDAPATHTTLASLPINEAFLQGVNPEASMIVCVTKGIPQTEVSAVYKEINTAIAEAAQTEAFWNNVPVGERKEDTSYRVSMRLSKDGPQWEAGNIKLGAGDTCPGQKLGNVSLKGSTVQSVLGTAFDVSGTAVSPRPAPVERLDNQAPVTPPSVPNFVRT